MATINSSVKLQENISNIVKKLESIANAMTSKSFDFALDSMEAFDVQDNIERQLFSALANNPDENLAAQFEVELTVDTSQAISDINGIQDEIDEVSIGVSARTQAVTAAFDKITEKASEIQSRGIYSDNAMIAAGAEFSAYFSDSDAITVMMDTLTNYAMGMSGGGEIDAAGMASYAADLGNIMSGAYDTMTKNCFTFTVEQRAIIEGEATREQIVSTLGEDYVDMSSDMQAAAAIAQVVDEAWAGLYESMSNTPQGGIIRLNNAWGDMQETIGARLYPSVLKLVDTINRNWPKIEPVVEKVTMGLKVMFNVLSWLVDAAINVADAIVENWDWISPIVFTVVGALVAYKAATTAASIATSLHNLLLGDSAGASTAAAAATAGQTAAAGAATAAQLGMNTAMYSCPIFWIIAGIVLLIAIIYGLVDAINKVQGTSMSATAIICGSIMAAIATLGNMFSALWNMDVDVSYSIWNLFADLVNFIVNLSTDAVGATGRLFYDLCDFVLSILQTIATAWDYVFGDHLSDWWQNIRDDLNKHSEETFGTGIEVLPHIDSDKMKFDRIDTEEWFNLGVEFGEGVDDTIGNFFDFSGLNTDDDEYQKMLEQMEGMNGLLDGINGNTDNISGTLEITEEDLKYLRDVAEQEAVNRFTTAEITIEQTNNNNISSTLDLDGVVDGLTDAVNEAVYIISEGVHA